MAGRNNGKLKSLLSRFWNKRNARRNILHAKFFQHRVNARPNYFDFEAYRHQQLSTTLHEQHYGDLI